MQNGDRKGRRTCMRSSRRQVVRGMELQISMDPRIWSSLPAELIPQVLRYLPWWSNRQLRCTCKTWKVLLSDAKFLETCPPPSDESGAPPCFISLNLIQNLRVVSQLDLQTCCMRSTSINHNLSCRRSILPRLTVWSKRYGEPISLVPSLADSTFWDASVWVGEDESQSEFAPVSGIFFCVLELHHRHSLLLVNPFNSTFRQLPPVPHLRSRCHGQRAYTRYAQLVADDENPRNLKIVLSQFAYCEMNIWTLIVYDLTKGTWSTEGGTLPETLRESYLVPTSITLLSDSFYVLLQALGTRPRLVRTLGDTLFDHPMPQISYSSPNIHIFRHRGHLMLARACSIVEPFAVLDIWKSSSYGKKKTPTWVKTAVMPKAFFSKLCVQNSHSTMNRRDFVIKFYVDGDFVCFKPRSSTFFILLDLVKWRWELITSDDQDVGGFSMCQPNLGIVL